MTSAIPTPIVEDGQGPHQCRLMLSWLERILRYKRLSSAKRQAVDGTFIGMSLMYKRNSSDPRTLWDTIGDGVNLLPGLRQVLAGSCLKENSEPIAGLNIRYHSAVASVVGVGVAPCQTSGLAEV